MRTQHEKHHHHQILLSTQEEEKIERTIFGLGFGFRETGRKKTYHGGTDYGEPK